MRYFLLLCGLLVLSSCSMTAVHSEKINGLSYVAARDSISMQHVKPVSEVNANYVAIMPFGFVRNLENPEIYFNSERQWFGETTEGAKQYISQLRTIDIKVMLKPQIWVWRGEFTGDIKMTTEEDWKILEESYSNFILTYADLAEELKVEVLCIGTELEEFINGRPEYWDHLISKIKERYNGKLTYAANWDEFKRTPFWDKLDYIGVDAYFPVSESQTPTVEECRSGWQPHKEIIKEVSDRFNKKVLFTEFGYRSTDFTGKEPWNSDYDLKTVNLEAQVNATQALFDEFWSETWFAGGFVWKWFHNDERINAETNSRFTPQNKPAEEVIRQTFSRY